MATFYSDVKNYNSLPKAYQRRVDKIRQEAESKSSNNNSKPINTGGVAIAQDTIFQDAQGRGYSYDPKVVAQMNNSNAQNTQRQKQQSTKTAYQVYSNNFKANEVSVLGENIQRTKAFRQPPERMYNPQETITTEKTNTALIDPVFAAQKSMYERKLRLSSNIDYAQTIKPGDYKAAGKFYKDTGELFLYSVGEGAVFALNPVNVIKGTYETISKPTQTVGYLAQGFRSPSGSAQMFGQFAGQSVVLTPAGIGAVKGFRAVKPYARELIKGNKQSFIDSSNFFVDQNLLRRTELLNRQSVKGNIPFKLDTSGALKADALFKVTGEKYIVQSDIYGNYILKPMPKPKGFLAEQGIKLNAVQKADNFFGDVKFGYAKNPYGVEALTINKVQTKLFNDKFARSGKTKTPNVLLSSKSIAATNPRYIIVDYINPSKSTIGFVDKSYQSSLIPNEKPIIPKSRNTLKELYGKNNFVEKPQQTIIDNSDLFKNVKINTQSAVSKYETLGADYTIKAYPENLRNRVKFEIEYSEVPTPKVSKDLFENIYSPKSINKYPVSFVPNALKPSEIAKFKANIKPKQTYRQTIKPLQNLKLSSSNIIDTMPAYDLSVIPATRSRIKSSSRNINKQIPVNIQVPKLLQKSIYKTKSRSRQYRNYTTLKLPVIEPVLPPLVAPYRGRASSKSKRKRSVKENSLYGSINMPSINFRAIASLPAVFIYEAKTGREAGLPRQTPAIVRTFKNQLYGQGDFNKIIPVTQGYSKRKRK